MGGIDLGAGEGGRYVGCGMGWVGNQDEMVMMGL